ncbi:MAG TPA: helix-turn-helix transcriptional regulator, partial [Tissierellaceae bacterium]
KSKPISLNSVKYICFELINTAIKVAAEIDVHNSDVDTLMEKMTHMETLDEIYTTVLDFYRRFYAKIKEAKMSKSTELRDKVMQYIKDNYMNSMLSVGSIADHFSISPSYLSRYMKDYLGRSLTDYIHEVRLERAKFLLEKTDKPVAYIAEEVGYNSLHNFSRVFKRYEGITPTDYRLIKMNRT